LPDKAIDVIDEAGARVKLRARKELASIDEWDAPVDVMSQFVGHSSGGSRLDAETDESISTAEVTKDDIEEVIARWTGIPSLL